MLRMLPASSHHVRMPAKYSVEITPAAELDVEEIWTYIADDSPENATAFIFRLEVQIEALEQFPARCPLIPENEIEYQNSDEYISEHLQINNYEFLEDGNEI